MAARFELKIHSRAEVEAAARALPRPLVFTNGVFDILHRGHVTYLDEAAQLGAIQFMGGTAEYPDQQRQPDNQRHTQTGDWPYATMPLPLAARQRRKSHAKGQRGQQGIQR